MKTILVLGAAGTLGLPICMFLKEKGYHVIAACHSTKSKIFFQRENIDFCTFDLKDEDSFKCLPLKVDCILNFAGALPAMMSESSSNLLYSDTIIRGTINVLEYAKSINCDRIIFPQSVYDLHYLFGTPKPISADAMRKNSYKGDHAIYVTCKNAAVDILEYYYQTYGIKKFILRLPGVYQYHPKPFILIDGKRRYKSERIIIEKAKRSEDIEIWGDPKRVLESVCIEDFLDIVYRCIEIDNDGGIYNVGNGGSTLEERILGIRKVFCPANNQSRIIYRPEKKDCTQYVLDISKTQSELGYVPRYNWIDYLSKLKWHMQIQPYKEVWGSFDDYYDLLINRE